MLPQQQKDSNDLIAYLGGEGRLKKVQFELPLKPSMSVPRYGHFLDDIKIILDWENLVPNVLFKVELSLGYKSIFKKTYFSKTCCTLKKELNLPLYLHAFYTIPLTLSVSAINAPSNPFFLAESVDISKTCAKVIFCYLNSDILTLNPLLQGICAQKDFYHFIPDSSELVLQFENGHPI